MAETFNGQEKLQQQHSQLVQLEKLLNAEKAILEARDPEQLLAISEEKNKQLLAISQLDEEIGQSLQFKQEKTQGLHKAQLNEIEALLVKCKALNQVNGQIIEHSQLAVERMKTSLLSSHNKSSMTYNAKGKTSGGLASVGIKA